MDSTSIYQQGEQLSFECRRISGCRLRLRSQANPGEAVHVPSGSSCYRRQIKPPNVFVARF